MAGRSRRERRRLLGTYSHNDTGDGTTVRLPKQLEDTPFPNGPQHRSQLELVEPDDGEPYLEVHPIPEDQG